MSRLALLLTLTTLAGCAAPPLLVVTRWEPPAMDLGGVRQLGVTVVKTPNQGANAVLAGLFLGQIRVASDPALLLERHLAGRLPEVGVTVCQPAPCGDATLVAEVHESSVGSGHARTGYIGVDARLRVVVVVKANDGAELMNWRYDEEVWTGVEDSVRALDRAAEGIAVQFVRTLSPRHVRTQIPLEDEGPLREAAELLLAGQTDAAERSLQQLAQEQPGLAGTYYDLGVIAEVRGDYVMAASLHRQAVQRDPKRLYVRAARAAERVAPQR